MKKEEMLEQIREMAEVMSPEINRLEVQSRIFIHEKAINLKVEDIKEAYLWIKKVKENEWLDCHHYYKRHTEDGWDMIFSNLIPGMNEVEGFLRTGEALKKALISGTKPLFYKKALITIALRTRKKRGRPPKCQ